MAFKTPQFKIPTKASIKRAIATDNEMTGASQWINHDLAPTQPDRRTWNWLSMSSYWWSSSFSSNQWSNGASLIAVGLTWWQALLAAIIANAISSSVALGMARPGATYHIGYPVLARGVFGMYGAYFFVALRACVAIIWYGVQTYFGGKLLSVALRCIFGDSWQNIPDTLPLSSGTSSRELLAFFLFWLIQFPLQFVHPSRVQHLFTFASVVCPVACFGLFGWCVSYGGGLGVDSLSKTAPLTGGALGWAMLNGVNSVMGTLSPLLVNQPDFARYVRKPRDAGWPQGASIFVSKTVIFFLGCGATAAVEGKFGEAYWNQWDLLGAILDRFWTPGARAGCFLAAFGFAVSTLTTNFGANSMPFGSDVTGLLPKYLTIKRGQVICSLLGICVLPWKILSSAAGFLTFLGSYGIFMGPLCAIIICDYFIVKRGNIHVPSLYDPSPGSLYYHFKGWNLVSTGCWTAGMVFGLPGLIGAYEPTLVSEAAIHMYQTGWVLTFGSSFIFYTILSVFVTPPRVFPAHYEGSAGDANNLRAKKKFEALCATEGFLDGESVEDLYKVNGGIETLDGKYVEPKEYSPDRDLEASKMDKEY